MEAVIRLHPSFKDNIGTDLIKVRIDEDETVDTLLMKISRRYPRLVEVMLDPMTGELQESYEILLNGRKIKDIHTKLKHKDELSVMLPEPASSPPKEAPDQP
jgi:molybdopterin converting factor small subunit